MSFIEQGGLALFAVSRSIDEADSVCSARLAFCVDHQRRRLELDEILERLAEAVNDPTSLAPTKTAIEDDDQK